MTLPFIKQAQEGRAVWHVGALLNFKATGEETDGQFWMAEQTSPPGYTSPLHTHTREDEIFVVLDGEMSVRVGEEHHKAVRGAVVFAPRGLPHQFQVEDPDTRFLLMGTPAGFENWFFETGEPAQGLVLPPPPKGPPDVGKLLGALERYGARMEGPPPGPGDDVPHTH